MNQNHNQYLACAEKVNCSRFDGKRFFITGATGLVGKFIVAALLCHNEINNADIDITVVGRDQKKFQQRFWDVQELYPNAFRNVRFIMHDFNEPYLEEIQADYVLHLASNTHPRSYATDPIGTEMANIFGTYYLLHAMKNSGGRFFLASSGDVYGDNRSEKKMIDEDDCGYINCNTLRAGYIEGKRASEALCQAFKEKYGMDFVTGRLCRIYGITMQTEDSKAITQFIKKALSGEDIVLKSAGLQTFSYLSVYDVATAIFTILLDGCNGEAYNVADRDHYCSLNELAETIAGIAGVQVTHDIPDEIEQKGASTFQSVILNSEKLEALGWKAEYGIQAGIQNTLEALKSRSAE